MIDNISMIGQCIKEMDIYPTRKELWECLPKKIPYWIFDYILEWMDATERIIYDDNKILWTYPDNPKLQKLIKESKVLR